MISVLVTKTEFPYKSEEPSIWTNQSHYRCYSQIGGGGFRRPGYEKLVIPKPGYSAQNCLYEGIYD